MKKILFTGVPLLLVLLLGVFAYLEIWHGENEVVPQSMTTKEVQKECPEVMLTGRDKSFAAAVLDVAAVREARQSDQGEGMIEGDAVAAVVEEYYPELENWMVTVNGTSVMLEGMPEEDVKLYLQFSNVVYLRKLSAHYREAGKENVVTTLYENLNGETYQQYVQQHTWFAYLKK